MCAWKTFLAAAFWTASGAAAFAQGVCEPVLKYASYNYSTESQKNTAFKKTYDSYCRGDKTVDTSSLNIGINAVVEEIPIGFDLGSGSSQQKLSNFCKVFSEELKNNADKYVDTQLVSVEAVDAWRACVQLYGEGVEFEPMVNTTQAAIKISKKTADPVDIEGIQYNENSLKCTVPNSDTSDKRAVASIDTTKRLLDGSSWSIRCDRVPVSTQNEMKYLEADLTVYTSKGNFSLKVPPDSEIGVQSSAAINKKLSVLESALSAQAKREPVMECRTSSLNSSWKRSPTATASMPADALRDGFKLVGGGCDLSGGEPGSPGGRAHNGPITASRPTDANDGWSCKAMDPPNIPLSYSVRAWAVYCKASMSK
jgi:hypothetical protein